MFRPPTKDILPEDGHNRWPKHVGGLQPIITNETYKKKPQTHLEPW